jgi:hypothetical protein
VIDDRYAYDVHINDEVGVIMRLRTVLVATAFAATAVLGGAATASADAGPYGGHHGASGAGGFAKEGAAGYYHNLGGPAGITHAGGVKFREKGWLAFTGF